MKPVLFQTSPISLIDTTAFAHYKILSSPIFDSNIRSKFPLMPPIECLPEFRRRFQLERVRFAPYTVPPGSKRPSSTNESEVKVIIQSGRIKLNFIKRKIQNLITSNETIHHKVAEKLLDAASEYANMIVQEGQPYPVAEINLIKDQLCRIVCAYFDNIAGLDALCEKKPHMIPHIVNGIRLALKFIKEVDPTFDYSNLEYRLLLTRFLDDTQTFSSCLNIESQHMKKLIQDLQIAEIKFREKNDESFANFIKTNLTNLMRAQMFVDPWAKWKSLTRPTNSTHLGT